MFPLNKHKWEHFCRIVFDKIKYLKELKKLNSLKRAFKELKKQNILIVEQSQCLSSCVETLELLLQVSCCVEPS